MTLTSTVARLFPAPPPVGCPEVVLLRSDDPYVAAEIGCDEPAAGHPPPHRFRVEYPDTMERGPAVVMTWELAP
jgi:hypothetical protein